MQNYLDSISHEKKLSFNILTLKDYIIEITKQRMEKLELFDKDFTTYLSKGKKKTTRETKKTKNRVKI